MRDLVYFYDSRKKSHLPLMYSIRSAEKNMEFRKIWIIGKKPDFLNDKIEVIEYNDTRDRMDSTYKLFQRYKSEIAVNHPHISKDFVWMNDDFYILQNIGTEVPYYHSGRLSLWAGKRRGFRKKTHGSLWKGIIARLYEKFPRGYFFEVHAPIIFNKAKLRHVLGLMDNSLMAAIKSYYCNYYEIEGEYTKDFKAYEIKQLERKKVNPFLSSRDKIEKSRELKEFLHSKFSGKSSYEKKT